MEQSQGQYEQGPDSFNPHKLNALMHDLDDYNAQFSIGAMMARKIFSALEDKDTSSLADQITDEQENQALTAAALDAIHADTLQTTGLSLEPVAGKSAVMFAEGNQVGNGELRVNISDGNRFLGFLGSLDPDTAQRTGTTHSLARLANTLSLQVLDNYDLKNPTPEALELVGRLERISEEYRRLGVEGPGVTKFSTYLAHSRAGDLREFVGIQRQGLMQAPGNFGPADWQTDATPEFLNRKWGDALRLLDAAKQNPRATALHDSLREHLAACATHAQDFLATHPGYYGPLVMADMASTLEQARLDLQADEAPSNS